MEINVILSMLSNKIIYVYIPDLHNNYNEYMNSLADHVFLYGDNRKISMLQYGNGLEILFISV